MDTARDHFLAGSGFAQQERRPAALPKLLHQPEDLPGPGGLAH
jgi:hypothetical protein